MNTWFIAAVIYIRQVVEDIKQIFTEDLIDKNGSFWMDIQVFLDRGKYKVLKKFKIRREYRLIENTVDEIKN